MITLCRIAFLISIFFFMTTEISKAYGAEIAVIKSQYLPSYQQAFNGFKKVYAGELRVFDLKGDPQESEKVVIKLRKDPPDLILAIGLLAARVAEENFHDIPIVYCMVFDPSRFGLYRKNITGVALDVSPSEMFPRLKELFPNARRIGVLFDPEKTRRTVDLAIKAAQDWGISLIPEEVHSAKDLPDAARILLGKIDLLWLIPDSTVVTPESLNFIFLTSLEDNLPVVAFSEDLIRAGAVMSLSPDPWTVGEQAGRLVQKVIEGKIPINIPHSHAEKIKVSFNMSIAKKIGLRINREALNIPRGDLIELISPEKDVKLNPKAIKPGKKLHEEGLP